jgi:NADH:ubiquinone oxidoreductase subunit H
VFLVFFILYSYVFTYFCFDILNIVLILDFILIGGILPLIERKELALTQRRVGPKFAGLNGRLQFIIDALKIFFKHYFILIKVKKYSFFLIPLLFFLTNL